MSFAMKGKLLHLVVAAGALLACSLNCVLGVLLLLAHEPEHDVGPKAPPELVDSRLPHYREPPPFMEGFSGTSRVHPRPLPPR